MRVAGLSGGIACGKSTVSALLEGSGIAVIDCDQLAREVVRKARELHFLPYVASALYWGLKSGTNQTRAHACLKGHSMRRMPILPSCMHCQRIAECMCRGGHGCHPSTAPGCMQPPSDLRLFGAQVVH